MFRRVAAYLTMALFLAGCAPARPTATPTSLPPTLTSTPTLTPTITSTKTLVPSATFTPTFTPTSTLTPFPTLSYDQARSKFKQFLKTNGNCRLPCWWGIVPGKTTWGQVEQFFSQFTMAYFSQNYSNVYSSQYQLDFVRPDSDYTVPVKFTVNDSGVVVSIEVDPAMVNIFPLYIILQQLGQPTKIFLKKEKLRFNEPVTFMDIYLVYEEGIQAIYEFVGELSSGSEPLRLCEYNIESFPATFSLPDTKFDTSGLTPLESVTQLTTKSFYDGFRSHSNNCFMVSGDFLK